MKAMLLKNTSRLTKESEPLEQANLPDPQPGEGEILLRIHACGVCHTELDEIEGRTPPPEFPVVPGHQVVGRIAALGKRVSGVKEGDRVGVAWIFSSCGRCSYCNTGRENLCREFMATGRDRNGGYATEMVVPAASAYPVPDTFTDLEAAPLLCAGAIGYRSLMLTGVRDGQSIGLTGFGASAHLVLQMARHKFPGSPVYVFARNAAQRSFALELGAVWAGDTGDYPENPLDCIIDTTPVWEPVIKALERLKAGGRLVINAIRKEDGDKKSLLDMEYSKHLWMEKEIKSVANVSRSDVRECLSLASEIPIRPVVHSYSLEEANSALLDLKNSRGRGAKVLKIS